MKTFPSKFRGAMQRRLRPPATISLWSSCRTEVTWTWSKCKVRRSKYSVAGWGVLPSWVEVIWRALGVVTTGRGKLGHLAGGQQEGADAIELSVVLVHLAGTRSDPLYPAQLAVRLHRGHQS